MKMVTITEALAYGFVMMGYFAIIGLISIVCITTGLDMIQGNDELNTDVILGSVMWSFGVLLTAAGAYGASYKLIADAVMKASEHRVINVQNSKQLPTGLILRD